MRLALNKKSITLATIKNVEINNTSVGSLKSL